MKKFFSFLTLALAIVSMVACTPSHDKTIANLKAAIDGEATASAKYTAFAEQAVKDSLFAVEALFKATAQAEAIHVNNYQTVLAALEVVDYQPTIGTFEVGNSAQNLENAIEGEMYEYTEMYPLFIGEAEAEKVQDAVVAFNFALGAETKHAAIYSDVQSKLATPELFSTTYFVCPKCGNVYAGTASETCELCQTGVADFVAVAANMPVVETPAEEVPAK